MSLTETLGLGDQAMESLQKTNKQTQRFTINKYINWHCNIIQFTWHSVLKSKLGGRYIHKPACAQ